MEVDVSRQGRRTVSLALPRRTFHANRLPESPHGILYLHLGGVKAPACNQAQSVKRGLGASADGNDLQVRASGPDEFAAGDGAGGVVRLRILSTFTVVFRP